MTTTTTTVSGAIMTDGGTYVSQSGIPATSTVVVTHKPPALLKDVVISRPSSSHQWVEGFWTWRNNQYEWMAGHWEVPPSSNSKWIAPRWERRGNAYEFYEGYWN